MAYSNVLIESAVGTGYAQPSKSLARDSTGRLWAVFHTDNKRYVKTRYSDDDGLTWSDAATVRDLGVSTNSLTYNIVMGNDDVPMVVSYKDDGDGSDVYFDRWNGSAWALASSIDMGTVEPTYVGKGLSQSSTGRWWYVVGRGTTTAAQIDCAYSDDDGSTWSSLHTMFTGPATSAMLRAERGPLWAEVNADDVLCVAWSDYHTASGKHAMHYGEVDVSTDPSTPSLAADQVFANAGSFHANGIGSHPCLAFDDAGDVYLVWCAPSSGSTNYRAYFAKRTSGVWGSMVDIDSSMDAAGTSFVWVAEDGLPRVLLQCDADAGGVLDRVLYEATSSSGAAWGAPIEIIDSANVEWPAGMAAQYNSGMEHTRLASGVAFVSWDSTNTNVEYYYENPVWAVPTVPGTGAGKRPWPDRPRFRTIFTPQQGGRVVRLN